MKLFIFLITFILISSVFAKDPENRFEAELKYLEQEALTTDEVKLSNSAILKQQSPKKEILQIEVKENEFTEEEPLFFKTKEVRPRRIRSR